MVNVKTTQLLVVWEKNLLKHSANHLIHFPRPLFNAKHANMLSECPAEKPARNRGLSCLEVKGRAGGNGAGREEWPIFLQGRKAADAAGLKRSFVLPSAAKGVLVLTAADLGA